MSSEAVYSSFELDITDEILQNLNTAGNVFSKRWEGAGDHSAIVPNIPAGDGGGDASTDSVSVEALKPRHSVLLEKLSDTVVKLIVTVYKSETAGSIDVNTTTTQTGVAETQNRRLQTDEPAQTSILSQTEQLDQQTAVTQTHVQEVQTVVTQTHVQHSCDSSSQTTETRLHQAFNDCSTETEANMSTQIDGSVMAVTESMSSFCQATVTATDANCQSSVDTKNLRIQTEFMGIESSVQTDPKTIIDTIIQTDSSMALETDASSQVYLDTCETSAQTELAVSQSDCQTDMSMALQADSHVQATVDMGEQTCQTELSVQESGFQTDSSMSTQVDGETQSSVEVVSQPCQTELSVEDSPCQTDSSMALQTDCGVQAATETNTVVSQTDIHEFISQANQTDEPDLTSQANQTDVQSGSHQANQTDSAHAALHQANQTDVQAGLHQANQTDSAHAALHQANQTDVEEESSRINQQSANDISVLDSSILDCSVLDSRENLQADGTSSSNQQASNPEFRDGVSQTDPVTIIIGDASFLVKKLKSSAVSPSKVTTTGNEIEIELSADVAGSEETTFEAEEKENELRRRSMPERVVPPRGSPQVRGGRMPGVAQRGGGVRMRMPVAAAAQAPVRPPIIKLHPGPTSRIQTPVMPTPAPVITHRIPGPQPVAGGSFSCPFCTLYFIDSPALYEHLSATHQTDQKTKWKQPRGREGKTIIPRRSDSDPPILTPVEPYSGGSAVRFQQVTTSGSAVAEDDEEEFLEDVQEAGLFEDPVEPLPKVAKKRRGRSAKTKSEYDHASVSDDEPAPEIVTTGKRRRGDAGAASKRQRTDEDWNDSGEEAEDTDEVVAKAPAARKGRVSARKK